jgi:hypothetical protein
MELGFRRIRFIAPREINMSLRYYETSLSVTCSTSVKITILLLWLCSPLLGLGRIFSFLILYTVGRLLGRVISPSQGCYPHTGQHKYRMNAHNTDIHALSGIRTHDPSFRTSEYSSCFRPRGHCDRLKLRISGS